MGLFGKKKVEEVSALEMINVIDKDVNDMAGKIISSGEKTIHMIHMSGVDNGEDARGKGKCLAVIGNSQGLIDMLYSAAMKEKGFAKILFSAALLLSSANKEMARLKTEVANEIEGSCECPACIEEASGDLKFGEKGVKIEDLANMTEDQMNDLVKKIVENSIRGSEQG